MQPTGADLRARSRITTRLVVAGLLALVSTAAGCEDGRPEASSLERRGAHEIAFICKSRYALCLVDAEGLDERLVTDEVQVESFAWSPTGERMVLATMGLREFERGRWVAGDDLYVLDSDGSLEQLTSGGEHDTDPAWSPDGATIAFSSDRDLERTSETAGAVGSIYALSLDDRAIRRLTFGPDDRKSAWSPDGTEIAFIRGTDIWIVSADGTNARPLPTRRPTFPTSLAWSPDGRHVAVGDFEGGVVHILSADGSTSRRVEFSDHYVSANGIEFDERVDDVDSPDWAPDGEQIAFAGATDCRAIFIADVDGRSARRVSACGPEYEVADSPRWRPVRN